MQEFLDCREREVWTVAEDTVTCLRQANQSCCRGGELAGEVLDDRYRADRVVFACQDQDRGPDVGQHTPGVETRRLVPEVVQVDLCRVNRSGQPLVVAAAPAEDPHAGGIVDAVAGGVGQDDACAGRKLGYRFWPGLSCGGPVLVEQSAQTLSASDPVDPGRERDHVRFVFGGTQKHSVALVAAPGVVMGDVDVEHVA